MINKQLTTYRNHNDPVERAAQSRAGTSVPSSGPESLKIQNPQSRE